LVGLLFVLLLPCGAAAQQDKPATWDPYHAYKNVQVGRFYLKKGRYDAAISRFREALRDQPDNAEAFLYLGEAYEKKGEAARAIQSYREYLRLWPEAKNAPKIRKKIERLSERKPGEGLGKKPVRQAPSG
jgi:Tfp pilus assembly protein PilF